MEHDLKSLIEQLISKEKSYSSKLDSALYRAIGDAVLANQDLSDGKVKLEEPEKMIIKGLESYAEEIKILNDDFISLIKEIINEIKKMSQ